MSKYSSTPICKPLWLHTWKRIQDTCGWHSLLNPAGFQTIEITSALLHFESSPISHHKEITEVILLKHLRAKVDVTMHINVLEFISPTYSHVQHKMFCNSNFCSILPLQITVDVLSKRQFQVCNMTITCVCWQAVCLTKSIYNLQKHWQMLFTRQHMYNTLYMCWPLGDWSCEGLVWWIHSTPAESEALKSKQAGWSAAFHKRHNNNNNISK